jgi:hypothetical protein
LSLPLQSFSGRSKGTTIKLSWSVPAPTEGNKFIVQRTTNQMFNTIGQVHSGNLVHGNSRSRYTFVDTSPRAGDNYYRIKQIAKNGQTYISSTQAIPFTPKTPFKYWLNNERLTLTFFEGLNQQVHIQLVNFKGQVLYKQTYLIEKRKQKISVNLREQSCSLAILQVRYKEKNYNNQIMLPCN